MSRTTTAIALLGSLLCLPSGAAGSPEPTRLARAGELTPLDQAFTSQGFEQIADRVGVTVFKDEAAEAIRIGAEGRFAGTPEQLLQVLLDYDHQAGRVARLSTSRILERGDHRMLVYQRLNLPVISDRDFNLEVTWGRRGAVLWMHWRAVGDRGLPPQPGVVRVTDHEGSWQLEQLGSLPVTEARFQVRMDMAGLVPRWMVRSGAGKQMPEFFQSLRGLLAEHIALGGVQCKSNTC